MTHPLWQNHPPMPLRPASRWPGGRRLAVYVAVGIEEYDLDGQFAENLLPPGPTPDFANVAWRDYGNRVGGFRLIDALAQAGIRPTVLLNTDAYGAAPGLVAAARAAGAEFVGHGVTNSHSLAVMTEAEERAFLAETAAAIAQAEGAAPGGWSSPWLAQRDTTVENLSRAGYRYLLDWRMDDQPAWLGTRPDRLLAIPYAAELNDSSTMIGRQMAPRDFADAIVDEFDELLAAASDQALVMSVVLHSFISGQPFRLRALRRAFAHLAARPDLVWLAQPREIAAAVAADPALAVGG